MILYIIIAAVLIVNIVNPRILWYVDSWKYKDGKKEDRYRRTPVTLFSDGSLSGLGERLSCVYIYDDNELVGTVIVSDEGGISVNDKSYVMKDASDFIRKVSLILNGTGERTVEGKI